MPAAHPTPKPTPRRTISMEMAVVNAERPQYREELEREAAEASKLSVPSFLVLAWITAAVLTLWSAKDLRSELVRSDLGTAVPVALSFAQGLTGVFERSGLENGKAALEELADRLRGGRSVPGTMPLPVPVELPPPPVVDAAGSQGSPDAGVVLEAMRKPRVLMVGASSFEFYLGVELERAIEKAHDVQMHRLGKLGSGLIRQDVFDWPETLGQLLESYRPDVVLAQLGGNDAQPILLPEGTLAQFGTPEWDQEYEARVRMLSLQVQKAGARFFAIGMPITQKPRPAKRYVHLNDVWRKASVESGGRFIELWDLSADRKGQAHLSVPGDRGGAPFYLSDGVHFSREGARYVVERLLPRLEGELALPPKDETLASVRLLEHASAARGRTVRYLSYVPGGGASEEKFPVLYLLHGAGDDYEGFQRKAHRELQKLSQELSLILVLPDGDAHSWYVDSERVPGGKVFSYLKDELPAHVRENLPASERQAVAGISMGGNGALVLALESEAFVSASSLGGAVDLTEAQSRVALQERLGPYPENTDAWTRVSALQLAAAKSERARELPVLLTVGVNDRWAPANKKLWSKLSLLGSSTELSVVPGGHDWDAWGPALSVHVRWHAAKLAAR